MFLISANCWVNIAYSLAAITDGLANNLLLLKILESRIRLHAPTEARGRTSAQIELDVNVGRTAVVSATGSKTKPLIWGNVLRSPLRHLRPSSSRGLRNKAAFSENSTQSSSRIGSDVFILEHTSKCRRVAPPELRDHFTVVLCLLWAGVEKPWGEQCLWISENFHFLKWSTVRWNKVHFYLCILGLYTS